MTALALILPIICALALICGCSSDSQFDDLDARMALSRERPQGSIEPLPTYPPAERFNYSALAMRSPFETPLLDTGDGRLSGAAVAEPDQVRQLESLEQFNYSALSMVGTLSRDQQIWALINDGEGRIHRVTQGNYLGRNFGRITQIDSFELEVLETVPDGSGGWVNRPRTLAMDKSDQLTR